MLRCPYCSAPITLADLYSRRLLCPRTCNACGGQYFEGGTTIGMAVVGTGGGLASSIASLKACPAWVPLGVAVGFALVAVLFTQRSQPRKVEELRAKLLQAVVAGPVAALVVWGLVAMAT
jgi:hypothetical protein